jgi:hypothetical protein
MFWFFYYRPSDLIIQPGDQAEIDTKVLLMVPKGTYALIGKF